MAVYINSIDKNTFIILLNESFFSCFLMTAPNNTHVDVATKAVKAKLIADSNR